MVCLTVCVSLHLAQKYAQIFVRGHYMFQVAKQEQIMSEHIFKSNESYCVYYPLNIYRNTKIGEYQSDTKIKRGTGDKI